MFKNEFTKSNDTLVVFTREEKIKEMTKLRFLKPGRVFSSKKSYTRKDKSWRKDV